MPFPHRSCGLSGHPWITRPRGGRCSNRPASTSPPCRKPSRSRFRRSHRYPARLGRYLVRQASEGRSRVVARPAGVPGRCCGSDRSRACSAADGHTGIERSQDHHHPRYCLELVVAPLLARYHVAMHRADIRVAARSRQWCSAKLAAWVLETSHTPTFRETYLMTVGLGRALYSAALTAVMYLGLEPFVRRQWPRSLISWTRVLSGRVYDPLVGTHVLIGVALAIGVSALARVGMALNGGRDLSTTLGQPSVLALLGGRQWRPSFPLHQRRAREVHDLLFLVFLFKVLLRNTGLTVAAATLLMTAAFAGTGKAIPSFGQRWF